MPIEFSVAAFRLGHSMVRGAYNWNRQFDNGEGTLDLLFDFSGTSGALGFGNAAAEQLDRGLPAPVSFTQAALKVPAAKFNFARRIDTRLATLLGTLPPGSFGATNPPADPINANLAFRNLARAKMLKLATGQGMVTFLQSHGVSVTALSDAQIRDGNGGASLAALTAAQRDSLVANTPLWFYILREAELNNGKLRGVGARIVAETIHRAMEGATISILRDPSFVPSLGPHAPAKFDMPDLLFFAFEGKADLLNPLGDGAPL